MRNTVAAAATSIAARAAITILPAVCTVDVDLAVREAVADEADFDVGASGVAFAPLLTEAVIDDATALLTSLLDVLSFLSGVVVVSFFDELLAALEDTALSAFEEASLSALELTEPLIFMRELVTLVLDDAAVVG